MKLKTCDRCPRKTHYYIERIKDGKVIETICNECKFDEECEKRRLSSQNYPSQRLE